jgi:hypothetical protein
MCGIVNHVVDLVKYQGSRFSIDEAKQLLSASRLKLSAEKVTGM